MDTTYDVGTREQETIKNVLSFFDFSFQPLGLMIMMMKGGGTIWRSKITSDDGTMRFRQASFSSRQASLSFEFGAMEAVHWPLSSVEVILTRPPPQELRERQRRGNIVCKFCRNSSRKFSKISRPFMYTVGQIITICSTAVTGMAEKSFIQLKFWINFNFVYVKALRVIIYILIYGPNQ